MTRVSDKIQHRLKRDRTKTSEIKVACDTWKRRTRVASEAQGSRDLSLTVLVNWRGPGDARKGFTEEVLPKSVLGGGMEGIHRVYEQRMGVVQPSMTSSVTANKLFWSVTF